MTEFQYSGTLSAWEYAMNALYRGRSKSVAGSKRRSEQSGRTGFAGQTISFGQNMMGAWQKWRIW